VSCGFFCVCIHRVHWHICICIELSVRELRGKIEITEGSVKEALSRMTGEIKHRIRMEAPKLSLEILSFVE